MATQTDIDRLIELGLNRYGAGDLDGALLFWEEALAVDPDNAQANSYVDYVRQHYDMLASGEPELADDPTFAISEEPEYQIAESPGELARASQPALATKEQLDSGWDLEETHDASPRQTMRTDDEGEDATREYWSSGNQPPPPPDFGEEPEQSEFELREATGTFQNEGTPVGFAHQVTSTHKRDLGFIKPQAAAPQPVKDKPSSPMAIGTASTIELATALEGGAELEGGAPLEGSAPAEGTAEHNPFADLHLEGTDGGELTKENFISRRATRDMPTAARTPARRTGQELSQAEVMLPHAPTEDFGKPARIDLQAPTRELGLRQPLAEPPKRAKTLPGFGDDDDAPTGEADVRKIRDAANRLEGTARPQTEGTKSDIVLPFDPIAARSAEILDDVDEGAPPDEPHDEQTRRRITMLLQRAIEYNTAHEPDKAVTAVDLALSEDPNSAIGQKLITRNKDTIMQLFQAFIGDLDRMPQLAKPLHELANAPISPRAAFLLSRIDGTLTIDELLDVSGMPRMEAYRHICQLFLRGILR